MSPLIVLGAVLVVALVATLTLAFPIRKLALAKGWVDRPDGGRKLHERATPSIGGVAIVGGFAVGLAFLLIVQSWLPFELSLPGFGLWAGALAIVCAGFYDDVRNLTFKQKFAVQIIAAILLVGAGYRIELTGLGFADPRFDAAISIPLSLLWVVGVTNAINLIDGVDGLAAGTSYIALSCYALIYSIHGDLDLFVLALPLFGALAGFLIHNFSRASVFMGDSGSLFLGFMLAAASLQGSAHSHPTLAILIPPLVLAFPLVDTLLSIARRASNGRSVFSPDRDHIHHRMMRYFPKRSAVLRLYVVSLSFGGAAFLMAVLDSVMSFTIFAAALFAIIVGILTLGYFRSMESPASPERQGLTPAVVENVNTADNFAFTTNGDVALASNEVNGSLGDGTRAEPPITVDPSQTTAAPGEGLRTPLQQPADHSNGSNGNGHVVTEEKIKIAGARPRKREARADP